ncbi:MAG: hypothetical protein KJ626_07125 [Verrucomicrobia bacterium]|nr:hypothetical protein [Verrucomicrobiota bacterium]
MRPAGPSLLTAGILAVTAICGSSAHAQFLRLGGIDFYSTIAFDLIYTTNVEGLRDSEAEREQKDYYYVVRVSLDGELQSRRRTKLTVGSDLRIERHFKRDDLDQETDPFGSLQLDYATEVGRYNVGLFLTYDKRFDSREDQFVPGGREKRDVNDVFGYGVDVGWEFDRFSAGARYEHSQERHDDAQFQDGDRDEDSVTAEAGWTMNDRLALGYAYTHDRTIVINDDAAYDGWDDTHLASLDVVLIERPRIVYILGYEREDSDGEKGNWEATHSIRAEDDIELFDSPNYRLAFFAQYDYEKNREANDRTFVYGATLDQQVTRSLSHSLIASREPRDTFGSTVDTDTTSYGYRLTKEELFIRDLMLNLGITYEINDPPDLPEEKILTYDVLLTHDRRLTEKISRIISYQYTYEDNSNEDEILDEHRVTLTFVYEL